MSVRLSSLPLILFCLLCQHAWSASMLRISCEGDSARAEVSINGQFKGECPMDVEVRAGDVRVRAVKNQNVEVERVFEDSFRLGDGVIKRVEIQLGKPQYTAEGMRRLQARKQAEEEAARRAAEEKERARLQKIAEAEESKRQARERLAAGMATLREQGVEPGNGKSFRDCPDCPAMVMIPRGPFVQSIPLNEPVAVSQHEITRGEFARYLQETGRKMHSVGCDNWRGHRSNIPLNGTSGIVFRPDLGWNNPGFTQTDEHPVVCVSIAEADDYVRWLSEKTGLPYRLPTVDWWYTAAGAPGPYESLPPPSSMSGNLDDACKFGNVLDDEGNAALYLLLVWQYDPFRCSDKFAYTAPVGQFPPNSFALHDMAGNVSEWVTEPALPGQQPKNTIALVAGMGWHAGPLHAGRPGVLRMNVNQRANFIGFRVMRYLTPQ